MGSSSSNTKSAGNGILENGRELTPMQKHSLFFDINKDGIIYPWETYQALRSIGAGFFLSAGAAIFINVFTSQKTRPGKWPSPLFPIEIANIKFGIHGSDTGAYDSEGMFVPSKFEEIFAKHAKTNPNYLTSAELNEMLRANRDPKDFRGQIGALGEWRVLYIVAKDDKGLLSKEKIRGAYDGSLFEQLAKEHASKKKSA